MRRDASRSQVRARKDVINRDRRQSCRKRAMEPRVADFVANVAQDFAEKLSDSEPGRLLKSPSKIDGSLGAISRREEARLRIRSARPSAKCVLMNVIAPSDVSAWAQSAMRVSRQYQLPSPGSSIARCKASGKRLMMALPYCSSRVAHRRMKN